MKKACQPRTTQRGAERRRHSAIYPTAPDITGGENDRDFDYTTQPISA